MVRGIDTRSLTQSCVSMTVMTKLTVMTVMTKLWVRDSSSLGHAALPTAGVSVTEYMVCGA